MRGDRTWLVALLAAGVCCVVLGFAGGAATYAQFVDTETASGTVTAAQSFGGGGGGQPGATSAYNDANGNGQYDAGETNYTMAQLYSFDDPSADLVLPASVGTLKNKPGISITANSISADSDLSAKDGGVTLEATGGSVDIAGQTVTSRNGGVDVDAAGSVSASGAVVESRNVDVSLSADGALDVSGATLWSRNAAVRLSAGGPISAVDATLQSRHQNVQLDSGGAIDIRNAGLWSRNGQLTADLGSSGSTLSVGGAEITDRNGGGTLTYTPSGVTVAGTPAVGTVQPA